MTSYIRCQPDSKTTDQTQSKYNKNKLNYIKLYKIRKEHSFIFANIIYKIVSYKLFSHYKRYIFNIQNLCQM